MLAKLKAGWEGFEGSQSGKDLVAFLSAGGRLLVSRPGGLLFLLVTAGKCGWSRMPRGVKLLVTGSAPERLTKLEAALSAAAEQARVLGARVETMERRASEADRVKREEARTTGERILALEHRLSDQASALAEARTTLASRAPEIIEGAFAPSTLEESDEAWLSRNGWQLTEHEATGWLRRGVNEPLRTRVQRAGSRFQVFLLDAPPWAPNVCIQNHQRAGWLIHPHSDSEAQAGSYRNAIARAEAVIANTLDRGAV